MYLERPSDKSGRGRFWLALSLSTVTAAAVAAPLALKAVSVEVGEPPATGIPAIGFSEADPNGPSVPERDLGTAPEGGRGNIVPAPSAVGEEEAPPVSAGSTETSEAPATTPTTVIDPTSSSTETTEAQTTTTAAETTTTEAETTTSPSTTETTTPSTSTPTTEDPTTTETTEGPTTTVEDPTTTETTEPTSTTETTDPEGELGDGSGDDDPARPATGPDSGSSEQPGDEGSKGASAEIAEESADPSASAETDEASSWLNLIEAWLNSVSQ
jgi:hypothetical protein